VNGATTHNEGERRRREMLEIALSLEERFRTLLPPENRGGDRKRQSFSASLEPENAVHDHDSDEDSDVVMQPSTQEAEKLKFKIKVPSVQPVSSNRSSTSADVDASLTNTPVTPIRRKSRTFMSSPLSAPTNQSYPTRRHSELKSPTPTEPLGMSPDINSMDLDVSVVNSRHHKRMKPLVNEEGERSAEEPVHEPVSTPVFPSDSGHSQPLKPRVSQTTAFKAEQTSSALVIAALRSTGAEKARTHRSVTAFGTKIPSSLEVNSDYMPPAWLIDPPCEEAIDEKGDRVGSPTNAVEGGVLEDNEMTGNDLPGA
jgi:hypothetical protein